MTESLAFDFSIAFEESLAFAELSGDHNPLHVDPVAARRTQFGGTVVHGIHALLKATDLLADRGDWAGREPVALSVTFNNPVRSGTQVSVHAAPMGDDGRIQAVAESEGRPAFTLNLAFGAPREARPAEPQPSWPPPTDKPRELAFPPAADLAGAVPLGLDPQRLAAILHNLCGAGHLDWVADLLASTRIVGMECPGLHSIYSGLRLTRRAEMARCSRMRYRIDRIDPRFRFVRIAVAGDHFEGVLETFFRPPAVEQRRLSAVAESVPPGLFRGQKALVVGGSRGLGEVVAKILLAGGAEVTITYARGQADAERIQVEAMELGLRCEARPLDAAAFSNAIADGWLISAGFSHVYYFASPRIEKNASGRWNDAIFEGFAEVYLRGFAELAETIAGGAAKSASPIRFLYPSSVFLDTAEPGFAEYCAAKAAGEGLARHLARGLGVLIAAPRLPRMRTDQTSALIDVGAGDPFPVMFELLRGFHA